MNINTKDMVQIENMQNENVNDKKSLNCFKNEAFDFIENKKWCKSINKAYLGFGVDGILGIFLFQIVPNGRGVDNEIWVIVGDIPPAYITTVDCQNPFCAIDGYIGEMELWVDTVKKNKSVRNLIPVNVPPTIEYAEMLESRLEYLDKEILSDYEEQLI